MAQLDQQNTWGLDRFADPDYLKRRIEVEKCLHREFISKGGKPSLANPIYFYLGRNSVFEERPENKGYVIELKDVASDSVSFSYGDSLLAFNQQYRRQSGPRYANPLCLQLFRMDQLASLFSHVAFPRISPLRIEVHLWTQPSIELVKQLKL
jgi:hypothetical protein